MKINPAQLKSLRIQHRLSCKELAEKSNVSDRTISRIETSDTERDVRSYIAERLARELGVEVDMLANEATVDPGQLDGTEGSEQSIHPKRLKDLRTRKKLSRKKLADRAGVSERQITRIEASKKDVSVRMNTMIKLASALGVDAEMLADDPTSLDPLPVPPSQDVQLSIKINSQVRLAYDLVKHRYGPSQKEIIKLAPLLYVLLAEGSLAWRRQWLEEAIAAKERLEQLTGEREGFYTEEQDVDWDESFEAEQESIKKNELLGDEILSGRGYWQSWDGIKNPFLDYVTKLSKELGLSGIINSWGHEVQDMINSEFGPGINLSERINQKERQLERPTKSGFVPMHTYSPKSDNFLCDIFFEFLDGEIIFNYLICQDELVDISGNSLGALLAMVRGDVRLPEIPGELMTEQAKDKRVEWLESRISDETQEIADRYRALFAEDYDHEFGSE